MPRPLPFILILALVSMAGCATRPDSKCSSSSWEEMGFLDGRTGRPAEDIRKHTKACHTSEPAADREAYFRGRDAGLAQYCTGHGGFFVGRTNGSYEGVCASRDEASFLIGFNKGRELLQVRRRLDGVTAEIAKLNERREKRATNENDRAALDAKKAELQRVRGELLATQRRIESETEQL